MSKQEDETSSHRRARKPLLYVALGAIFLLGVVGFGVYAASGPSEVETNILFATQFIQGGQQGVASAQVRSSQSASSSPAFVMVEDTGLVATIPPVTITPKVLGAILGEASFETSSRREITHYVVEEGETIDLVAEKFGVSVNTILWANELNRDSTIQPGEELVVLPTSGALHLVRPNDTLSEIAVWYLADMEDILDYNDLDSAEDIFVGDILIIPDGRKPTVLPNGRLTPLANSYFIYPVPQSYKITQGLHAFNAVDLSGGVCGSPAYAAAGGTVQRVGFHNTAGNYVRILHPNGVVTFYGHLGSQAVGSGEKVLQGQIIGYVGHTGYTIPAGPGGCHLHLEVRGASNPFAK